MKNIYTFFSLVAALAVYAAGSAIGSVFFLIVGVVFEGVFWTRLFRRKSTK
jgi:hypothetical protein